MTPNMYICKEHPVTKLNIMITAGGSSKLLSLEFTAIKHKITTKRHYITTRDTNNKYMENDHKDDELYSKSLQ